jgi:DNA-binding PadR family transcriptional regulator
MNKVPLAQKLCQYNYSLRVLAFLAEQKIATGHQIEKYCFYDASNAYAWTTLIKLRKAKLVERSELLLNGKRRRFGISLTKDGLNLLKEQSQVYLNELQIKSNTPIHDFNLSDIRLLFSSINECHYFIPENILRSKLLEEEVSGLATFRSHRCDAAVYINIGSKFAWLALEYERSKKSTERYKQRINSWYQAEDLPAILLITEDHLLIDTLSKIDLQTLPHLPRKILYLSKNNLLLHSGFFRFQNCKKEPLTFSISKKKNIYYPILDQNLDKCRKN